MVERCIGYDADCLWHILSGCVALARGGSCTCELHLDASRVPSHDFLLGGGSLGKRE
jgi:hypothetical protein